MLFIIQFPIADSRRFLDTETGLLTSPMWPSPVPEKEFVRSFGPIRIRRKGGINGWVGENEICQAHRALRFRSIRPIQLNSHINAVKRLRFKPVFRHFFCDGLAVSKFETGLLSSPRFGIKKTFINFRSLLSNLLDIEVLIPEGNKRYIQCHLSNASKHIAKLYCSSSISKNFPSNICKEWWVTGGTPMVLLCLEKDEELQIPLYKKDVPVLDKEYGIEVSHTWIYHGENKDSLRLWILRDSLGLADDESRLLRIYLLRLHAEHECMKIILNNISRGRINVSPHSNQSDTLQLYLNEATRRISRTELKVSKLSESNLEDLARESEDIISPGQRDSLLHSLKILNIRGNIYRKLEGYSHEWQSSQSAALNIFGATKVDVRYSMSEQHFQGGHFEGCSFGDQNSLTNYFGIVDRMSHVEEDIKQKLKEAREVIERENISNEDKSDAINQLNSFTAELEKPEKNISRVQRFWNRIKDVSPTAAAILSTAASLAKLLAT